MIKDDLDNFLVNDGTDTIDQLLEEITRLEIQNEQLMNSLFEANGQIIHWRNLNKHLQQRIDNFNEATWEPTQ